MAVEGENGLKREKGRNLILSNVKGPIASENESQETIQYAAKNFDYTTIVDRHRTISWRNNGHPTGAVKPVHGIPTFQLTAKAV